MIYNFKDKNNTLFSFRLLTKEDLEETISLCNECVGENLYSKEDLRKAIEDSEHFFYLVTAGEKEIAGYIYYYLTDLKSIADYTKLNVKLFYDICSRKPAKVAKIQSVAVRDKYRGSNFSVSMIDFALGKLKEIRADIVFGVCWKMGEYVPMKKTLCECGFTYFSKAEKIWYEDTKLICPYCKGRCVCDAEVYYRYL